MESILTSIRTLIVGEACTHFDTDLIMHINTVFMTLTELGVGPDDGFYISDESATWEEFFEDKKLLHAVKSYMYIKVRLLFEPNALTSAVITAMNNQVADLEWRIREMVENPAFNGKEV